MGIVGDKGLALGEPQYTYIKEAAYRYSEKEGENEHDHPQQHFELVKSHNTTAFMGLSASGERTGFHLL